MGTRGGDGTGDVVTSEVAAGRMEAGGRRDYTGGGEAISSRPNGEVLTSPLISRI